MTEMTDNRDFFLLSLILSGFPIFSKMLKVKNIVIICVAICCPYWPIHKISGIPKTLSEMLRGDSFGGKSTMLALFVHLLK